MIRFRKSSLYFTALVTLIALAFDFAGSGQKIGVWEPAHAQSATATLNVTVVDPKGAAVPSAEIVAINVSTAFRRKGTANNEGQVAIAYLAPGRYDITAHKQGFDPSEIKDVALSVNDVRGVQIQLKVGSITASVQVSAANATHSENSSVSTVVDRHFIENLPLNGRSFNALLELTPGSALAVSTYN